MKLIKAKVLRLKLSFIENIRTKNILYSLIMIF